MYQPKFLPVRWRQAPEMILKRLGRKLQIDQEPYQRMTTQTEILDAYQAIL